MQGKILASVEEAVLGKRQRANHFLFQDPPCHPRTGREPFWAQRHTLLFILGMTSISSITENIKLTGQKRPNYNSQLTVCTHSGWLQEFGNCVSLQSHLTPPYLFSPVMKSELECNCQVNWCMELIQKPWSWKACFFSWVFSLAAWTGWPNNCRFAGT